MTKDYKIEPIYETLFREGWMLKATLEDQKFKPLVNYYWKEYKELPLTILN